MMISFVVALSLSPALSALILKPRKQARGLLGKFYAWFNDMFGKSTNGYVRYCGILIRKSAMSLIFLGIVTLLVGVLGKGLPGGFLPEEDQGYFFAGIQLPNAASLQRTNAAVREMEKIIMETPGVEYCTSVSGYSMLSGVVNTYSGFFFVTLKPWGERKSPEEKYANLLAGLNARLSKLPQGVAFAFSPPAIPGIGTAGGVTFLLQDRAGKDIAFLAQNMQKFMVEAVKRPEIARASTTFLPAVPQIFINVDRDKALKQGVDLQQLYGTLQSFMGGSFVNYFTRFGRQWQVYVQAEGDARVRP